MPRNLCIPSKAALLILLWSLVVGIIYFTAKEVLLFGVRLLVKRDTLVHSYDVLIISYLLLLVYFIYLPAGYLADVCTGRYRIIIVSLCLMACAMLCLSVGSVLLFTGYTEVPVGNAKPHGIALYAVLFAGGSLILIVGFAGYEANHIQFGLDQLSELPSQYVGLFVHWVEWIVQCGGILAHFINLVIHHCTKNNVIVHMAWSIPFVFTVLQSTILAFTFCKRHWFSVEAAQNNPYKMVARVLNFARKHKYPLHNHEELTDSDDDHEPGRIDFAKERYGGPFTTEQVEDVKTFFRILLILLALAPVFAMEVLSGPVLSIFIRHVSMPEHPNATTCTFKEIILNAIFFRNLATAFLFLVYIWLIYSVLRRCVPKIFTRITIGSVVLMTGIFCMFLIELFAHVSHYKRHGEGVRCLFHDFKQIESDTPHLDVPWAVNLVPGFLLQMGISIVITTTFEFISAQTPQAMKGLMIGVMFTIRGVAAMLISTAIVPFSIHSIWGTKRMKLHPPPVISCGFGYLLLTCIVGMAGLVLFRVTIKRYKYRKRRNRIYN